MFLLLNDSKFNNEFKKENRRQLTTFTVIKGIAGSIDHSHMIFFHMMIVNDVEIAKIDPFHMGSECITALMIRIT